MISGFLITKSWVYNPELFAYARKRIFRIVPGYLAASCVSIAVAYIVVSFHKIGLHAILDQMSMFDAISSTVVFIHNPYPHLINASMWTIHYEIECYMLIAILGMMGLFKHRLAPLLAFLAAIVFTIAQHHYVWTRYIWPIGSFEALSLFSMWYFAGTGFYVYRSSIPRSPLLAAAAGIVLIATWITGIFDIVMIGTALALPYLLFYFAFTPTKRLHAIGKYGDFSYGVYLYAWLVQQVIVLWIPGIGPLTLFAIAVPLALLCGILSWHLVEKPFMRRKHSRTPVPQDSAVAMA